MNKLAYLPMRYINEHVSKYEPCTLCEANKHDRGHASAHLSDRVYYLNIFCCNFPHHELTPDVWEKAIDSYVSDFEASL